MPFTPNNSEQRLPPTCYRGCWHVVCRGLFTGSCHHPGISSQTYSSPAKGFYNLSAFVIHAASLRQTFVHCGIFLAAASRRSLGRISVPMWPFNLSVRLLIIALVGHYPANKLISRELIFRRSKRTFPGKAVTLPTYSVLSCVSTGYPHPEGRSPTCYSPVRRSRRYCYRLPLDLHA
jgi:hypothetical protein